ncbi:MAG: hypothetical protein QXS54_12910 [Candidatus Methanomethylicaceae archaeon]
MKWNEYLAELREELQDTGSTPRWSDTVLRMYTRDAIYDYSRWLPRRVDRYALTTLASTYALPSDFIEDVAVEYPLGNFLMRGEIRPAWRLNPINYPAWYVIANGALRLNCDPPAEPIYLTYLAYHKMMTETEDTSVPDFDIEIIRLYVMAMVHRQLRAKQSRLDRFDSTAGRRDDNPLTPETDNFMEEYYRKISERIRGGAVYLYRSMT